MSLANRHVQRGECQLERAAAGTTPVGPLQGLFPQGRAVAQTTDRLVSRTGLAPHDSEQTRKHEADGPATLRNQEAAPGQPRAHFPDKLELSGCPLGLLLHGALTPGAESCREAGAPRAWLRAGTHTPSPRRGLARQDQGGRDAHKPQPESAC